MSYYEKRSQSSGNKQKQCLQAMDVIAHAYGNIGEDYQCKPACQTLQETQAEFQHAYVLVHRQGCKPGQRVLPIA